MNRRTADPPAPTAPRGEPWPMFVLSLEDDEARRAPLLGALSGMGLEPEVLIGVDGRDGLPEWAEAEVDRNAAWTWDHRPRRHMTNGELACALSHARAYRKIVEDGLPGAILFEDDAIIDELFGRFVASRGYEAAEVVLLGHKKTWVRRGASVRLTQGVTGHRLVDSPFGAFAYTVSDRAARHFMGCTRPVRAQADWPCDISRLKALATVPQIAWHPDDQEARSIIERDRRHTPRKAPRPFRFLSPKFWARSWRRRLGHRIS